MNSLETDIHISVPQTWSVSFITNRTRLATVVISQLDFTKAVQVLFYSEKGISEAASNHRFKSFSRRDKHKRPRTLAMLQLSLGKHHLKSTP